MLKVTNPKEYLEFKKYLYTLCKYESVEDREHHKAVINTNKEIIGLTMANIRAIAKDISKTSAREYLALEKGDTYEEVMIWGIVIASLNSIDEQLINFEKWVEHADTWALIDSVCVSMKKLKKCKDKDKYFNWFLERCYSQKEFVARFGIIMLMTCFLEEKFIDKIVQMCKSVTNHAYYVDMAIAWLVSELVVKFNDKGIKLIEQKSLSKFVQNKAISKCHDSFRLTDSEKEYLTKFRIK